MDKQLNFLYDYFNKVNKLNGGEKLSKGDFLRYWLAYKGVMVNNKFKPAVFTRGSQAEGAAPIAKAMALNYKLSYTSSMVFVATLANLYSKNGIDKSYYDPANTLELPVKEVDSKTAIKAISEELKVKKTPYWESFQDFYTDPKSGVLTVFERKMNKYLIVAGIIGAAYLAKKIVEIKK